MPSDDQREVTEYIIQALVEGRSRDEVARNVAQRYELNLRQAEGLVLRVETVYDRDITARRSPIYFGISLLTLLGGVALAAVLGHNYSLFLGFKGGKGVATSFGTLLFLDPILALWTFPIGVSVMLLTRYVSAGSMTGGVAATVLALALSRPLWEVVTVGLMALLIFWTHRENLKRLQAGTERRLGEKEGGRA
mgnify:CR=1 FL=1